jgi:excisionase family DNA binding protein
LVGLDEAAARLSLSRRTLQSLLYAGKLRSVKIGRCRRVAIADLELFVEGLRDDAAPNPQPPKTKTTTASHGRRRGGQGVSPSHRRPA